MLPRKILKLAYDRVFQYKILNNVLYLNKKLYMFSKSDSNLCSFCVNADEDIPHLFFHCPVTSELWVNPKTMLLPNFEIPNLDERSALLGFYEAQLDHKGSGVKIEILIYVLLKPLI